MSLYKSAKTHLRQAPRTQFSPRLKIFFSPWSVLDTGPGRLAGQTSREAVISAGGGGPA